MSRIQVLLVLCVLLLGAVWYAWKETPRQQRVDNKKAVVRDVGSTAGPSSAVDIGSLDFSGGEKLSFKKPKRDLFRSLYRAPVVAKTVAPPPPKPAVVAPSPPPPPVIEQRPVVPPPRTKPIPSLNVLGFLRKGGTVTVFLASRQGDVFLVKRGDRFGDGLLVRELNYSEIVISRGLDDQGVTIKFSEQKKTAQRMSIPNVPSGRPSVPVINTFEPSTSAPEVGQQQEKVEP